MLMCVSICLGVANYQAASEEAPNVLFTVWKRIEQNKLFIKYKNRVKERIKKFENTLK